MAAYKSKGVSVNNGGSNAQLAVPLPASVATGDLLLLSILIDDNAASLTSFGNNRSYEILHDEYINIGGIQYHWVLLWKRAGGSELDPLITWSGTAWADGHAMSFDGVYATGTPFQFLMGSQTTGADHIAPAINSLYDNSLMVYLGIEDNYSAWSTASGFAEHFDGGGSTQGTIQSKTLSATGDTGTASSTTGAGAGVAATLLVFDTTPTGGGGGVPAGAASYNYAQQ